MATVCSKWAERLPSAVTTVHLSPRVRVTGLPTGDHRLDRERHALQQTRPAPWDAVVRDLGLLVELGSDAVAHQLPHDPESRALGHFLHRVPDVADMVSQPRLRDARRQALLRHPEQACGLRRDPADGQRRRRVGMQALELDPHVHAHDASVRKHAFRVDGMPCTISSSTDVQSVLGNP